MDVVSNWEHDRCIITTLMDHICMAIHFAMDIDKGATLERIKHNEPILDIYFPSDYFEYPNRASSGYKVFIKNGFHIVIYNQSIVITRINQDTEEKCATIPVNSSHQIYDRTLSGDLHLFFEHWITQEVFTNNGDLSNTDFGLLMSLCGKLHLEHMILLFTFIGDNESARHTILDILLGVIRNDWERRPEEKMIEWKDPLDEIISKAKNAYPDSATNSTEQSSKKIMKYCNAYEYMFDSLNDILIAFTECGLTDYETFVEYINKEMMKENLKYLNLKPSYLRDERLIPFVEECLKHYKE